MVGCHSGIASRMTLHVATGCNCPCPSAAYNGRWRHECEKSDGHQFLHVSRLGMAWGQDGRIVGWLRYASGARWQRGWR